MIIRNNLASKPTKNYSLFFIGCAFVAALALAFTAFNVLHLTSSYARSRDLERLIIEQQKKISDLKLLDGKLRTQIRELKTSEFVKKTEFINNAVEKRVFSWTKLFDQFEKVLPNNVKMVSVSPIIVEGGIRINMTVAGRGLDDIVNLITVLENHPAFTDVFFRSERQETDGLLYATISLQYLPDKATGMDVEQKPAEGASVVEPASDEDTGEEE